MMYLGSAVAGGAAGGREAGGCSLRHGKILRAGRLLDDRRNLRRALARRVRLALWRGQAGCARSGTRLRTHSHRPHDRGFFPAQLVRYIGSWTKRSSPIWKMSISVCAARSRDAAACMCPRPWLATSGSATSGEWNKDTVRRIARNQVLLARKHFSGLSIWPILAGQLLWGLVAFRHGRGFAYLRGKLQGLRAKSVLQTKSGRGSKPCAVSIVKSVLEESERHIFELQRQTGFDRLLEGLLLAVAAIIVTHNSELVIGRCLDALAKMAPSVTALVIDNASLDRTVDEVRARKAVRLIANQENRGFAAAVNQGVAACDAEFYLFLIQTKHTYGFGHLPDPTR